MTTKQLVQRTGVEAKDKTRCEGRLLKDGQFMCIPKLCKVHVCDERALLLRHLSEPHQKETRDIMTPRCQHCGGWLHSPQELQTRVCDICLSGRGQAMKIKYVTTIEACSCPDFHYRAARLRVPCKHHEAAY